METDVTNQVSFSAFSNVTLIDILNDKVSIFVCKDKLELSETDTYENYLEKLKKVIKADDLNNYYERISLNKLKEIEGNCDVISYAKLSSTLSYDNYIDIVKVLDGDIICIYSVKGTIESGNSNQSATNAQADSELSYEVADLIFSIETILNEMNKDSYEVQNSVKYITELLEDMKNKDENVLTNYRNKLTVEVSKTKNSLLVADDDSMMRTILKKTFSDAYNIIEAKDGTEAVKYLEQNFSKENLADPINIVGLFLDLKMPVMDGFGVLKYMREHGILGKIPVIIISADDAKDTKEKVYAYDIADMIEKPFNYALIKKRIGKLIEMYAKTNILKDIVRSKDTQIKKLLKGYSKAYLTDYSKINATLKNTVELLLTKYGEKSSSTFDSAIIADAAQYYDVGLSFIPKSYLNNMASIGEEERKIVLNYPNVGANIVSIVAEKQNDTYIKYASQIAKMHNERYDGRGFPDGLAADKIPMYMYLVNVAIDYSALKHTGADMETIKTTINSKSGNKYDPKAVEIFNEVFEDLKVME